MWLCAGGDGDGTAAGQWGFACNIDGLVVGRPERRRQEQAGSMTDAIASLRMGRLSAVSCGKTWMLLLPDHSWAGKQGD